MEYSSLQALPSGTILKGEAYTYEIVRVLGQGSFGITYLANVRLSGSLGMLNSSVTVAVKEFYMKDINGRSGNEVTYGSNSDIYHNYRNDFMKEARNISLLKHQHIIKILEAFDANNTCYFSMEYLEGGNLNEQILSRGRLSEYDALKYIIEISEALQFMHDNKMLHLDLKPQNVMLRKNGELVLIDFGLSKQFDHNGEPESSTRIGGGTIGYAPLEQVNYKKGDGFAATLDIYALGGTLFKMLTGITPPDASSIFNDGFPIETLQCYGISDDIILLISSAMEPLKRKRPQTVRYFLNEVNRLLPDCHYEIKEIQNQFTTQNYNKDESVGTIEKIQDSKVEWNVLWQKGLKESQKEGIRNLLKCMQIIGTKGFNPLMGSEFISTNEYNKIMDIPENTINKIKHLTLSETIHFLLKLEQYTGLSFCLLESSICQVTAAPFYWRENPSLFYNSDKGFNYSLYSEGYDCSYIGKRYIQDWTLEEKYVKTYCPEIGCNGISPVVVNGCFNIPDTQLTYDELLPIGLGFYKGKLNNQWKIITPENPIKNCLNQEYDNISSIDVYAIPGPGLPRPFIGIQAYTTNAIACYVLEHNSFKLIKEFSTIEWERMEMYT